MKTYSKNGITIELKEESEGFVAPDSLMNVQYEVGGSVRKFKSRSVQDNRGIYSINAQFKLMETDRNFTIAVKFRELKDELGIQDKEIAGFFDIRDKEGNIDANKFRNLKGGKTNRSIGLVNFLAFLKEQGWNPPS